MIRTFSALALALLLAEPVAAQQVRVDPAGKTDSVVRAEIRKAAEAVCRTADRDGAFRGAYRLQNCLLDAETRAVLQLKAYRHEESRAGDQARLASPGVAR